MNADGPTRLYRPNVASGRWPHSLAALVEAEQIRLFKQNVTASKANGVNRMSSR